MEMELWNIKKALYTVVNGKIMLFKVKVNILIRLVIYMKDNSKMVFMMGKALWNMWMVMNTLENGWMVKNMAKVFITIPMEIIMMVNG